VDGKKYIIIAIDYFSKWFIEMPTKDVLDEVAFKNRLQHILQVQSSVFNQAAQKILKVQEKQRKSFKKKHSTKSKVKVGR